MWRKILYTILISGIFVGSVVSANYVFNPFTGKLDRTMNGEAATMTSSTAATSTVTGGFFQTGLTDCDLDTDGVNYDLSLGKFICGDDDTGAGGTNDWAVSSTYGSPALTTTSSINLWSKNSLYVSSTLLVDGLSTFTYVSSTGFSAPYVSSTNLTAGNFTVVTSLSLPANSITDAMVANDITASNYLLLTGGTLTGGLSFTSMSGSNFFATNVSSTFASSTYTSTTALTAHAFFQNGLTDCSADNQALNYTLATGLITCGDDDNSGGGVNDWGRFGTTFNTSSLMTSSTRSVWLDGSLFVSSSAHFAGLQVAGNLSASSTLTVGGLSFFSSLSTFTSGFVSNASSSIGAGLQVAGALNSSSSLFVSTSLFIGQSLGKRTGTFTIDGLTGNLSTSGTLQTFGLSTFRAGFISNASSSIGGALTVSGRLTASTTAIFTQGLIGNASSSFGGALTISGRLTASTTSFFTQGLIGFTSSTFTGFLRAQNLSTSGSLYFGDNSVMTTGRYQMSKYYYYTSTTDFFLLGRAEVASTIRKCSVVLVCEESCRTETTRPGLQIDLFHGTSLAVLSSTTTVFTTSIYPNSTTTEQSFCASGCDITKTNSDVTLAVDEYLWMRVPSASTTQVSANIDCTLDHAS